MRKEIFLTKNLQYGLFDSEEGEYLFSYGTYLDEGLGTVINQQTGEEFKILSEKNDEKTGNIKSVVVEVK